MRHLMAQARFQNGKTFGHPDFPAVAIGEGDHAASPFVEGANASRRKYQPDQSEIAEQEAIGDPFQRVLCTRRAQSVRREIGGTPFGVGALQGDRACPLVEAKQGKRRHQHRGGK
jgi:hypothetical protein